MTPEERDRIMFRLTAAWPRPPMADETVAVWIEHLTPLQFPYAAKAIRKLEATKTHRPSLAELHEAYAAARPHPAELAERAIPTGVGESVPPPMQQLHATLEMARKRIPKPLGMTRRGK